MTNRRFIAFVPIFTFLLLQAPARAEEVAANISPADLNARVQEGKAPLIVDVRTPEEFRSGHIPGAINIPHDKIAEHVGELRSEHGVALYCMVGPRARLGEQALRKAGLEEVLHIEGGLSAWQASGLPVERD
jgi:rhodanese-related sulfurtransferase